MVVARLLWTEKIVEPLSKRDAFHSHVATLAGVLWLIEAAERRSDGDSERRKLACWLWSATLAGHWSRLNTPAQLREDIDALHAWICASRIVPAVVEQADGHPPTSADLCLARSRQSTLFRAVLCQLYAHGVRDLRTGEPIEVALHFGDTIQIDHIFATAWARDQDVPPDPALVDSIVNKTPLGAYTNNWKRGKAPSVMLAHLDAPSAKSDRQLPARSPCRPG